MSNYTRCFLVLGGKSGAGCRWKDTLGEYFAVAHYSPDVASCGTDELTSLAKWQIKLLFCSQQNSTASDCLGSVKVLFFWWDVLTSDLTVQERHALVAQEPWLLRADASSQECADFECGARQPWWLSNRCRVIIENMLLSAGDARSVLKEAVEPQRKVKNDLLVDLRGWFHSLCGVRGGAP